MKFRRRSGQQKYLPEELESHLEELTEELLASGYSLEEAQLEARRRFGNRTALLERSREVWRIGWLDALLRDLRFSWRVARRQPWTVAAAIASIAIGVGANTAVTSVVDTVLLNPLGIRNSDRMVAATVHITKLQMTGVESSGAEFRDLQASSDVFSQVAATENRDWTLGGAQPSRLRGVAVTSEFFGVFGVKSELRMDPFTVVISDDLWTSHFGRCKAVVGQKLLLDGKAYQIVGVAPPNFHYPARAEAWVPLILPPGRFSRGDNMVLSLLARLKDGISVQRAQQRVDHELLKLQATPDGADLNKLGYGVDVEPLARYVAGDLRLPLIFLWAAALVLLLATCANVAGLLLARAGARRREMAIRISIGAGRLQILRQLLTESLMLALFGGATGVIVAWLLLGMLKAEPLPYQYLLSMAGLNYRLLLYALLLSIASSLLFGVVPALALLREQHTGSMMRPRRKWFQNIYIVGQVSAAMLMLVVMGLLLKSLQAVALLRAGFDAEGVTTAFLIKPPQNRDAFYERLLSGLRASPGVQSAALAYSVPFGGDSPTSLFDIRGRHHLHGEPEWHAEAYQVTPDYLKTLRIPLLRGRFIQDTDTAKQAKVCVIDESLANRFFPKEDPIGQEIAMYGGWARIVGVVASVRDQSVESASRPVVYYSLAQIPYFPQLGLVVRSSTPAGSVIRNSVAKANPEVPVFDIKTMDERIGASEAIRSVMALLVTVFAAISILLAAIGIHGVVAQVVNERTSEIGIRMALGARASDIFRRYAMQGFQLSITGIVLGLALSALCAGWLRNLLYQVQPMDPIVILVGSLGVLAVTSLAVLVPSWRASHLDPQIALRSE